MQTISTGEALKAVIRAEGMPNETCWSAYRDITLGLSWEIVNEAWLSEPPKRHRHTPPSTTILPSGEGVTITGSLYEEMRIATDRRRERASRGAEAVQIDGANRSARRERYQVAHDGVGPLRPRPLTGGGLPPRSPRLPSPHADLSGGAGADGAILTERKRA
jgi:hypothetical protein